MSELARIKKLYESFRKKNIKTKYSLAEIDTILKEKYSANQIEIKQFKKLDPNFNYKQVYKIYSITDPNILSKVFTDEELKMHEEEKSYNQSNPEDWSLYSKKEIPIVKMWQDIEEGRRINIIIKSIDKRTMHEFSIQGESELLVMELTVLLGVDEKDLHIENEDFQYFLEALSYTGRI